jgi:hypothetical protein
MSRPRSESVTKMLGNWVRLQRQAAANGDTASVLDADERAELGRLRRENAELRLDPLISGRPVVCR